MKILITGATGFVGNQVVLYLLQNYNHEIICAGRDIVKAQKYEWFDRVKFIEFDLAEKKDNYYEYFGKPDLLIHLAWENLPNYKELFHIEKNLPENYSFIKNMIENGLKKLSVIGTCFEYGLQEGCLSEDIETKPSTVYGLAKDTLRKFVEELKKKYDFDYNWIRLFYLYGESQGEKTLLGQLRKAVDNGEKTFNMSGGQQVRDYLTVEQMAENIVLISLQNEMEGIVNSCSGKPISVQKFVENYIKENNWQIELNLGHYPYCDYEPMEFWGNPEKLNEIVKNFSRKKA